MPQVLCGHGIGDKRRSQPGDAWLIAAHRYYGKWTSGLEKQYRIDRSLDAVAFSPDGRTVAGSTYHNGDPSATVYLWEQATGKIRGAFHGHSAKAPLISSLSRR